MPSEVWRGFRHGEEVSKTVIAAVPGPWKRLTVGFAALFALAAGVAGWSLLRPVEKPVSRYSIALPVTERGDGFGSNVAISPDGAQIVYVGDGEQELQLWLFADATSSRPRLSWALREP